MGGDELRGACGTGLLWGEVVGGEDEDKWQYGCSNDGNGGIRLRWDEVGVGRRGGSVSDGEGDHSVPCGVEYWWFDNCIHCITREPNCAIKALLFLPI